MLNVILFTAKLLLSFNSSTLSVFFVPTNIDFFFKDLSMNNSTSLARILDRFSQSTTINNLRFFEIGFIKTIM